MLRQAEAGLKLENSFLYESFQQRQRFREDLQLSGTFQGLGHLNDLRREVTFLIVAKNISSHKSHNVPPFNLVCRLWLFFAAFLGRVFR